MNYKNVPPAHRITLTRWMNAIDPREAYFPSTHRLSWPSNPPKFNIGDIVRFKPDDYENHRHNIKYGDDEFGMFGFVLGKVVRVNQAGSQWAYDFDVLSEVSFEHGNFTVNGHHWEKENDTMILVESNK